MTRANSWFADGLYTIVPGALRRRPPEQHVPASTNPSAHEYDLMLLRILRHAKGYTTRTPKSPTVSILQSPMPSKRNMSTRYSDLQAWPSWLSCDFPAPPPPALPDRPRLNEVTRHRWFCSPCAFSRRSTLRAAGSRKRGRLPDVRRGRRRSETAFERKATHNTDLTQTTRGSNRRHLSEDPSHAQVLLTL